MTGYIILFHRLAIPFLLCRSDFIFTNKPKCLQSFTSYHQTRPDQARHYLRTRVHKHCAVVLNRSNALYAPSNDLPDIMYLLQSSQWIWYTILRFLEVSTTIRGHDQSQVWSVVLWLRLVIKSSRFDSQSRQSFLIWL